MNCATARHSVTLQTSAKTFCREQHDTPKNHDLNVPRPEFSPKGQKKNRARANKRNLTSVFFFILRPFAKIPVSVLTHCLLAARAILKHYLVGRLGHLGSVLLPSLLPRGAGLRRSNNGTLVWTCVVNKRQFVNNKQ